VRNRWRRCTAASCRASGCRHGCRRCEEKLVTVGRRLCDAVGADDARRGADVLDDHLLAQALAELRREDSRDHIKRAAGGERHDHGHGLLGQSCAVADEQNAARAATAAAILILGIGVLRR